MSNFKELCEFNTNVEHARHEARALVRHAAARLVTVYEKWLDLPAPHWVDERGKHAYVEVGELKNGEFVSCAPQAIPVDDDCALTMAVKTAVGSDSDTPFVSVVVHLKLEYADDEGFDITVTINEGRPIRVIAAATADEYVYADVLDGMKKHIMNTLKQRYPRAYLK